MSRTGGVKPQGVQAVLHIAPLQGGPMTASLDALLEEHAELERALADPAVHADAARARKLGRRYAELGPVVAAARELATARDDELETRVAELLVPRDPHDGDDVVLEGKSGEGGEESALFAGDLVRMY